MQVQILFPNSTFGTVRYKLLRPVNILGFTIPTSFVSDGATVPRLFWIIFPPVGRYFLAAVLHDYLLSKGYPWMKANKLFLEALKIQGVSLWVCYLMYIAVVTYKGIYVCSRKVFRKKGHR